MNSRALGVAAILIALIIWGVHLWFFDAADVPKPSDKRAIMAIECSVWSSLYDYRDFGMIIVQRDSYAAVTTFVDTKNLALYHQSNQGWVRVTHNGWLYDYDKSAFIRAGVPFFTANALVNGLRRQYHRWNPRTDTMAHC